jgi:hypothetical protein
MFASGVGNITFVAKLWADDVLLPLKFDPFQSDDRGVGNNPYSVASVRRTNGGSWYAMPFRIIPDRGQV